MLRLTTSTQEVVLDTAAGGVAIRYWGAPLGDVDLDSVAAALERQVSRASVDVVAPMGIVAEHGSGYPGRPGLAGRRPGGAAWAPRFTVDDVVHEPATTSDARSGAAVAVRCVDDVAELRLDLRVALADTLTVSATLTNAGTTRYKLDHLLLGVPLPDHAAELLRFLGRWTREFREVRQPFTHGALSVENRSGRSSQEHPPVIFAGTPGFGEWSGEVWGMHLGWSANHQMLAEVLPDGRRMVQFGELLHPGEVVLEPGQAYTTPTLYGSYSAVGLTPASWGFHRTLRALPIHPSTPRPVLINTWEAVYFDHDLATLTALADRAAAVGVERYVLDDGWFGSRRDDTSGLGDWWVSPDAHPHGLAPLIDHVRGLGMEFGIWVEPEMVNPDSDLFRAHPDWALNTPGYEPLTARQQFVLNLAHPDAYAHIRDQLVALLGDHHIDFVKWDMNRHHVHGSGADGAPGTHAQTLAVYRLLDELRQRFPHVEIESCSSGGGRVDFGILARTQRVWTSDCNDPLERQYIQRGVSTFLPPELMGAHIGPPRAHTTGRRHGLDFRAVTALPGHLGIEWNLLELDDRDLQRVAGYIALHRRFRDLLHTGDTVRFDPLHSGPGRPSLAGGVYSTDRREAVVWFAQLDTGISLTPPVLRLPGLLPDTSYRLTLVDPPGLHTHTTSHPPSWVADGITLTGRQLALHGLQPPGLDPETAILIHLVAGKD